jgi:hypothetical protein
MVIKILKVIAIAVLLGGFIWSYPGNQRIALQFAVCAIAIAAVVEAGRAKRFSWAVAFFAVAVLFNPFVAVLSRSNAYLLADAIAIAVFGLSLTLGKDSVRRSVLSVVKPGESQESL